MKIFVAGASGVLGRELSASSSGETTTWSG